MFKNIPYRVAHRLAKVLKNYIKKIDVKRSVVKKREEEEMWNKHFNNAVFFEYNLQEEVKINLYKDSVLSKPIYEGFEIDEMKFLQSTLNEGDIFIDIGANVGLFSLLASKKVGNTGKVIAFEPTPLTYSRLQENIILNEFKNIQARQLALSDTKGEMKFYISNNGYDAWNSLAPSHDNKLQESINVPVSTLDSELQDVDKTKVSLVKIDVEGWEKFTLKGGKSFFENYAPTVMVEFTEQNTFNAGYMVQDIYNVLLDMGYSWYKIENGTLLPDAMRLSYPYTNLIAKKAKA